MIAVEKLKNSEVSYYTNSVASDTAVIFLHGIPFNAKFWLKVIEKIESYNCYSFDLKGFGFNASSHEIKPLDYNVYAQLAWLEHIVELIPAERFVFIMHGWSAVAGTMLAQKLADKMQGLGFFEAQMRAVTKPEMLSLPMQEILQKLLQQEDLSDWVLNNNGYPELFFNYASITDNFSELFADQYREPACRAAILQYLYELPFGFQSSKVVESIQMNSAFLERSDLYKCLFYSTPGLMTTMETVSWAKQNCNNLTLFDIGHALHCAPLTMPEQFSEAINTWLNKIIRV